jgi:hypothetical protein
VTYADDGAMTYPRHEVTAPVSALAGYLAEARRILAEATPPDLTRPGHLTEDFDHLRWFDLPAACLR